MKKMLSHQQHDTDNPKQHILLIITQVPQNSRKAFLRGVQKLQKHLRKKGCCTHSMKHNEKKYGMIHRSRNCSPLLNGKQSEPISNTLHKMGHTQLATPMKANKSTVNSIMINIVFQKRSKAMEMCFYYIQYQIKQYHFHVLWKLGTENCEIFLPNITFQIPT